jgi:hypothetical protein
MQQSEGQSLGKIIDVTNKTKTKAETKQHKIKSTAWLEEIKLCIRKD